MSDTLDTSANSFEETAENNDANIQDSDSSSEEVETIDGLDVEEVVELPSGRTAVVHQVLGKHMRRASKVMQKHDAMLGNFEVFHQTVLLEGRRIKPHDWDEEPWADLQVLIEKVFPKGGPAQGASVM